MPISGITSAQDCTDDRGLFVLDHEIKNGRALVTASTALQPEEISVPDLLLIKCDYAMFQISRRLPIGIEPRAALPMSSILIRFIGPPRLILAGLCRNAETQKGV
jgi:hypothetical protein